MGDTNILKEFIQDYQEYFEVVGIILGVIVFILLLIPIIHNNTKSVVTILVGFILLILIYFFVPMYECLSFFEDECFIYGNRLTSEFLIGIIGSSFLLILGLVMRVLEKLNIDY
jgi:uncharacterized protein involved in cysteine biosynthesis